jgi:hypothetical protein
MPGSADQSPTAAPVVRNPVGAEGRRPARSARPPAWKEAAVARHVLVADQQARVAR